MRIDEKILMLGGSHQQVVAIETAKKLGYYTVLCDYLPNNPGQYVADMYYDISTTDIEKVYEVAVREKVDGILPYASDPAALPAAIIADRLNLPTNPSDSVAILGAKHKFREFLRENGFACPKSVFFETSTDLKKIKDKLLSLKFPMVVKPTDSSGSKGVSVVYDEGKLEEALNFAGSYSRK